MTDGQTNATGSPVAQKDEAGDSDHHATPSLNTGRAYEDPTVTYTNPAFAKLNQSTKGRRYLRLLSGLATTEPLVSQLESAIGGLNEREALILVYSNEADDPEFVYAFDGNLEDLQLAHRRAENHDLRLNHIRAINLHGLAKLTNISRHGKANGDLRRFLTYCEPKERLLLAQANGWRLPNTEES